MRSARRLLFFISFCSALFAGVQCEAQNPPQAHNQNAQRLTLADAESIAIQNHPRIQAATELATAAAAQVREVQSAYYPQASGALTGVKAENNSAIAAGFLTS